jgi:hypothetical protein
MAVVQNVEDGQAPVLNVTEARQGRRGKHVLWVLGISLALIIVGFFAVWMVHAPSLSGPGGSSAVSTHEQVPGFKAPPSQPRESENPQTRPTATPGVGSDGRAL